MQRYSSLRQNQKLEWVKYGEAYPGLARIRQHSKMQPLFRSLSNRTPELVESLWVGVSIDAVSYLDAPVADEQEGLGVSVSVSNLVYM